MSLDRNLRFPCLMVVVLGVGAVALVGCGSDVVPPPSTRADAAVDRPNGDVASSGDAAVDRGSSPSPDMADVKPQLPDAVADVGGSKDTLMSPDVASPPAVDAAPPVGDVPPMTDTASSADVPAPDMGAPTDPHPSAMSIAVFDEASVVDLYLTFPTGEWERLLTLTGATDTRWVVCTVAGFGTPATAASCRRKGDPLDWRLEKKPQIVVRFNRTDANARFRGLRRLNLESFDGAAAPIRDRVAMWMMREAGIDAPRVNNARVFKDGALLGVYLNIEAEDREFLEDHFGAEAGGNLWEKGFELKTNEDMPNQTRLDALNALINSESLNGDHTGFFTALPSRLDVAQVLLEMAGETALIADDNFSNGSTNFAYYEHPKRGFMVLPWDFDTVLTGGPSTADLYDYRGVSDEPNKLRRLMNQNPVWKKQYEDALVVIRDQHLARVPAKVDQVCAQIREAVRSDPNRNPTFAAFEADCVLVKQRAVDRVAAIKQLLGR